MAARILLIDDDAGIRESMRMPLEYEGYEYSASASAEEGIAAIQRDLTPGYHGAPLPLVRATVSWTVRFVLSTSARIR